MRKSEVILLTLLATPALLHAGINTWTSHGPGGGYVQSVAVDPKNSGTVYVSAGNSGVFKSTNGAASWNAASFGLPGSGYFLAVDPQNPSTLYAWNGRLFKSTDGAQSWNIMLSAPMNVFVLALDPQDPATIYVGNNFGAFKSTDGGATWSAVSSGLQGRGVSLLTLNPQNPATLYASVFSQTGPRIDGIFQSTDGGANWSMPLKQKLIDRAQSSTETCDEWGWYFTRVTGRDAPSPEEIACYADGDRTSSITIDQYIADLQTFAARQPYAADFGLIAGVNALLVDAQDPSTLYAVTYRGIFKSTDGALSWNRAISGMDPRHVSNVHTLAADPGSPGTLYAGVNFGGILYQSKDGAATWNQVPSAFGGVGVNVVAVDPQNSGTVYAGTSSGLFKSTNAAADWSAKESGLGDGNVSYLLVDPQNPGTVYAGAFGGFLGVFKSTDGATTWTNFGLPASPAPPGGLSTLLAIDPQNPAVLYAAGNCCSPPHPALFKSTDGGATWLTTGLAEFTSPLLIDPHNSNTLYARSGLVGGGIIKSTDGGNTWKPINSGFGGTPNNVPNIFPLILDPQNASTLYGVRYDDGKIFRTTDGGASWNTVNTGWDAALFHVVVLVADPQNSGTLYVETAEFDCGYSDVCPPDYYQKVAATGPGMFKSTDGGLSWVSLTGPPSSAAFGYHALVIDPRNPSNLFMATGYPSRVYRSTDGGASWTDLSAGLTSPYVNALAVDGQSPSTLYAATQGGGVFAITIATR